MGVAADTVGAVPAAPWHLPFQSRWWGFGASTLDSFPRSECWVLMPRVQPAAAGGRGLEDTVGFFALLVE